jgi:hypothetical protein
VRASFLVSKISRLAETSFVQYRLCPEERTLNNRGDVW